jgi:hypothetical protein
MAKRAQGTKVRRRRGTRAVQPDAGGLSKRAWRGTGSENKAVGRHAARSDSRDAAVAGRSTED